MHSQTYCTIVYFSKTYYFYNYVKLKIFMTDVFVFQQAMQTLLTFPAIKTCRAGDMRMISRVARTPHNNLKRGVSVNKE